MYNLHYIIPWEFQNTSESPESATVLKKQEVFKMNKQSKKKRKKKKENQLIWEFGAEWSGFWKDQLADGEEEKQSVFPVMSSLST